MTTFGGESITQEQAAAILPVVEAMRMDSLNLQKTIHDLWQSQVEENKRLREENERLKELADRYLMIRDVLFAPI